MKVIVVGAGSFGVWSALQLQENGHQVTLIDAWAPGNSRSSSGGETRVIRSVYGADAEYAEMAIDAFLMWQEYQSRWNLQLMEVCGSLWLCPSDTSYVTASMEVMQERGFELRQLSKADVQSSWNGISLEGIETVFFEPQSGILRAREGCRQVCQAFLAAGGEYIQGLVEPFDSTQELKQINLADGQTLYADAYVFACGPWLKHFFGDLSQQLMVSRQEVYYFGLSAVEQSFRASNFPVWLELDSPIYYGIPCLDGRGFKVALDERGIAFDPSSDDRLPTPALIEQARQFLSKRFPSLANSPLLETRVCQYTNTPDGHYLLDIHEPTGVLIAGGGSGHGYKMGPAIGKLVCHKLSHDSPLPQTFSLSRFDDSELGQSTQFDHRQNDNG